MKCKSEFLTTLQERGFLHQTTDTSKLDIILKKDLIKGYIGFDCTAPSLHVGSLIQIMMLRWFQKFGHSPIVLMGGGTTKIGDPSGKDSSRPILSTQEIDKNKFNIKTIFKKFLNFNNKSNKAIMIDNSLWLDNLNYISFLREYGTSFSVNKMLSLDSINIRLEREQNLSFLEFNYPIFQAFDFLELNKKYDCILQMGGSDQWGNIVNGVDLIRKKNKKQAFGLTSPLLTTSSGSKMGKSEKGAIWLDPVALSDYDFWQFWRNTEDGDVIRFLKLFTELNIEEINKMSRLKGSKINEAKITLANEVTKLCRGKEESLKSYQISKDTFNEKQINPDLPSQKIIEEEISIIEVLNLLKFTKSNGEARRLIRGRGVKFNNKLVTDENLVIKKSHFKNENIKISAGKKRHAIVYF